MMSILNAMYKENRNDSKGREIRKAYIDYAAENKDNPTGYSDEVYDKIKKLFDTDNGYGYKYNTSNKCIITSIRS